jgi:hypothetical protein
MNDDTIAAAILASALLRTPHVPFTASAKAPAFAAEVYFDCLEAIRAERAKRPQFQSENSGM